MVYFNSNNEVLYIVWCDVPYLFAMDLTEMNKKYPVIFDKKKEKIVNNKLGVGVD